MKLANDFTVTEADVQMCFRKLTRFVLESIFSNPPQTSTLLGKESIKDVIQGKVPFRKYLFMMVFD